MKVSQLRSIIREEIQKMTEDYKYKKNGAYVNVGPDSEFFKAARKLVEKQFKGWVFEPEYGTESWHWWNSELEIDIYATPFEGGDDIIGIIALNDDGTGGEPEEFMEYDVKWKPEFIYDDEYDEYEIDMKKCLTNYFSVMKKELPKIIKASKRK